mmetsp:Transcript_11375/g.24107  ORF Transcript_11375/g.24107 Transcript_11375/m.24107 type:complete len:254 (+) Transcript_11375:328-1089(+)
MVVVVVAIAIAFVIIFVLVPAPPFLLQEAFRDIVHVESPAQPLVSRPVVSDAGVGRCLVDRVPVPIELVDVSVAVGKVVPPVVQDFHVGLGKDESFVGIFFAAFSGPTGSPLARAQVDVPNVLRDALGTARFGNDRKAVMECPLQEDVGNRNFAVVVAVVVVPLHHLRQELRRVGQEAGVSVHQAPKGLDLYLVFRAVGQEIFPLPKDEGVHLDLVDHRHRSPRLPEDLQVLGPEIRDPDRDHLVAVVLLEVE